MTCRASRTTLIVVAMLAGGCRLDLTDIARPSRETELSLFFEAERGLPPTLIAMFWSGTAPDGKTRPLGDDALDLDGVPVQPDSAGDGYRHYTVAGLDTASAVFHIRPPSVIGVPEAPPEVIVGPIRVVAPDTVVATRPGAMELRITGIESDIQGLLRARWSVKVYSDSGSPSIELMANTLPDSLLTIPTSLLPPDLVRGRVVVDGSVAQDFASDGGGYRISIYRQFAGTVQLRIED